MFTRLSESLKKTISIADGYKLGRLVFEDEDCEWVPYIETETEGSNKLHYTEVTNFVIEVLNDGEWHTMTDEDYERVTAEGWPLFGGFDCRFKMKGEDQDV